MDLMKKQKAEIRRLRQELVSKPASKGRKTEEDDLEEGFSEEEKQAIKVLSSEQRKMLAELEQAGCNRDFLKKKIRACIANQD